MTERTAPPETEGGQDWSVMGGHVVPEEAISPDIIKLVNSDVIANLPAPARQRLLAVSAATIAFELSNPALQKSTGANIDFQTKAATEAMGDTGLDAGYLKVIFEQETVLGMGHMPIVDTIDKMYASGVIADEDTYYRALAIVSHLYAKEKKLKADTT